MLALTAWDESKAAADMVDLTSGKPFANQFDHDRRQTAARQRRDDLRRRAATPGAKDTAWRTYESALAKAPDDWNLHRHFAALAMQFGRSEVAVEHFRIALEKVPWDASIRDDLGSALANQGQINEAVSQYQQALKINPYDMAVHYNLGCVLAGRGQVDEAIACLQKSLEIEPDFASAHLKLAVVLAGYPRAGGGQLDEAVAHYQRALEINPELAVAHNNLGAIMARRGQFREAADHYRKAVEIKPDYEEAYNNLGLLLLFRKGAVDEAMADFQKAVAIKPDFAEAHYNLGVVLASRGQFDEAIAHLQKVLDIKPDFAAARIKMAELRTHIRVPPPAGARRKAARHGDQREWEQAMSRAMFKMTPTVVEHASPAKSALAETGKVKSAGSPRRLLAALFPPRVVLFAALFAWILHAWVDMRLVFQWRESLFLLNFRYLVKFLARPGALMEWTDRLMVQSCYWGWPGVLALTAAVWLLLVATIDLMRTVAQARVGGTWLVPAVLLTAICGQYEFRASVVVGLALAVTAANGWARVPVRRPWLRLVLFLVISAGLYYVAGPAYYSFAACCVIHEALTSKRRVLAVLCLLAAVGVKLGADAVFSRISLALDCVDAPPAAGYERPVLNYAVVFLYAYFPACAALVSQFVVPPLGRFVPQSLPKDGTTSRRALRWTAGTALLLTTAAVAGSYALDRELKTALEIDYSAEHGLWADVLTKARDVPLRLYSPCVNHDVNLALYHTGRLPYDMFTYPQMHLPLLTYQSVPRVGLMRKPFDLLLELGRVNEAEHVALEMLEEAPCGGTLKRLALVKLIKGQTAAARVVLRVLRDDVVWGRWAEEYLHRLNADPTLADDDEIQQTRRLMIVEDDTPPTGNPGASGAYGAIPVLLENSLRRNSGNRMAVEYLMAIRLLLRDVRGAAAVLSHLDRAAYPALPPLYEESLLIHSMEQPDELMTTGDVVFYRGRKISQPTVDRFRRFRQIMGHYGGPTEQAKSVAAGEFASSYFYYFFFHELRGRS